VLENITNKRTTLNLFSPKRTTTTTTTTTAKRQDNNNNNNTNNNNIRKAIQAPRTISSFSSKTEKIQSHSNLLRENPSSSSASSSSSAQQQQENLLTNAHLVFSPPNRNERRKSHPIAVKALPSAHVLVSSSVSSSASASGEPATSSSSSSSAFLQEQHQQLRSFALYQKKINLDNILLHSQQQQQQQQHSHLSQPSHQQTLAPSSVIPQVIAPNHLDLASSLKMAIRSHH
jgi:hypothetical protein